MSRRGRSRTSGGSRGPARRAARGPAGAREVGTVHRSAGSTTCESAEINTGTRPPDLARSSTSWADQRKSFTATPPRARAPSSSSGSPGRYACTETSRRKFRMANPSAPLVSEYRVSAGIARQVPGRCSTPADDDAAGEHEDQLVLRVGVRAVADAPFEPDTWNSAIRQVGQVESANQRTATRSRLPDANRPRSPTTCTPCPHRAGAPYRPSAGGAASRAPQWTMRRRPDRTRGAQRAPDSTIERTVGRARACARTSTSSAPLIT